MSNAYIYKDILISIDLFDLCLVDPSEAYGTDIPLDFIQLYLELPPAVPSSDSFLTLSPPIPLKLYTLPYWFNPPILIFDIRAL